MMLLNINKRALLYFGNRVKRQSMIKGSFESKRAYINDNSLLETLMLLIYLIRYITIIWASHNMIIRLPILLSVMQIFSLVPYIRNHSVVVSNSAAQLGFFGTKRFLNLYKFPLYVCRLAE